MRYVSATTLATMDKCETQVYLDWHHPKAASPSLRKAARRGTKVHARHHRKVLQYYAPNHRIRLFWVVALVTVVATGAFLWLS